MTAPLPAVVFVPETSTCQVLSSDGHTYYTVTRDERCSCKAGQHGHRCKHVLAAREHLEHVVRALRLAVEVDPFARVRAAEEASRRRA